MLFVDKGQEKKHINNLLLHVHIVTVIGVFLLLIMSNLYASGAFPVDNGNSTIIGVNTSYTIKDKESLIELARTYNIGYNEITLANSRIDPWVPKKGSRIVLPTSWILPDTLDDGIIINLAEMRLYYFTSMKGQKYISTYPIGIGRQGFGTPTGTYTITAMVKDPVWRIPESFRDEHPELPDFVPPGPDNPLGGYWLQLSLKGYGIHGTNRPYGIGRRVSHGCIRLYPEDIELLFKLIKPGTAVKIIDEPIKVGTYKNKVYIEVHPSEIEEPELMKLAVKKLSGKRLLINIDTPSLIHAIKNATGFPAVISK